MKIEGGIEFIAGVRNREETKKGRERQIEREQAERQFYHSDRDG